MTSGDIALAAKILGDAARQQVPIGPFTTYRLGGPAALFVDAQDEQTLLLARQAVTESGIQTLVVGKGSNILVSDRGYPGLVITLSGEFANVGFHGTTANAGGAVSLPVLARRSVAEGLVGMEWAVGVPGSVGGAVRMNAGGHGSQMGETLVSFRFVDLRGGEDGTFAADRLALGYRRSNIQAHQVVVSAQLALRHGDREKAENELTAIVRWRRENQPGGRNAGSVFTNPVNDSAGRLVEAAGMKGARQGSAAVSPKHANFIQSVDGGTAAEVLALMKQVREAVIRETGVGLEPEVRLVGFTPEELEGLR